jgi:hypothetical protein
VNINVKGWTPNVVMFELPGFTASAGTARTAGCTASQRHLVLQGKSAVGQVVSTSDV